MSNDRVAIKDVLPIPENIEATSDLDRETSATLDDKSTASHALAVADHGEKGAAQTDDHDDEVKNLGWNEHCDRIANPLVGGIRNEDLWVLIRRFNKVSPGLNTVSNQRPKNSSLYS